MAVPVGAIVKAAATVLTNEKLRKGVGWVLVAVLSPLILIVAVICSLATGGADHNNQAVAATFYGSSYSAEVPAEFRYHIEEMRTAFSLLDSAVSSANGQMDSGNGLDPINFDEEKLSALKRYMGKKELDLDREMTDALVKLYEKYVPAPVREYIDENDVPASTPANPSVQQSLLCRSPLKKWR